MIEILERIIKEKSMRMQLIKDFQEKIWNGYDSGDESSNETLRELAYDLDFYEPDKNLRNTDESYYGDDRLEEEIKSILQKLKK